MNEILEELSRQVLQRLQSAGDSQAILAALEKGAFRQLFEDISGH